MQWLNLQPRDTLLDHAYEIADKYGLAALSVRGLSSDATSQIVRATANESPLSFAVELQP